MLDYGLTARVRPAGRPPWATVSSNFAATSDQFIGLACLPLPYEQSLVGVHKVDLRCVTARIL